MNTINLLPLAERQPKWPINKLLFISSILLFSIYSSVYSYNALKIWNIEKDLQSARNQYELLQPALAMMCDSNNKQQLIDKKNNMIAFLTKERNSWYSTIQHLVVIMPQQLWFTDLSKLDKGVLQIKGSAANYAIVADFMKNIEHDPFFIEPTLNKVENLTTTSVVKFEIMVKSKGM
jgi:type IV pilus assembly protein PilN